MSSELGAWEIVALSHRVNVLDDVALLRRLTTLRSFITLWSCQGKDFYASLGAASKAGNLGGRSLAIDCSIPTANISTAR